MQKNRGSLQLRFQYRITVNLRLGLCGQSLDKVGFLKRSLTKKTASNTGEDAILSEKSILKQKQVADGRRLASDVVANLTL